MRLWMRGIVALGVLCFLVFHSVAQAQNNAPQKPQTSQVVNSDVRKASIRVLDKGGQPVAGAQLFITSFKDYKESSATTDAQGRLVMEIPPSAQDAEVLGRVTIWHPQHGLAGGMLKSGDNEFRFGAMTRIGGRVLDKDGKPAEGVAIRLFYWSLERGTAAHISDDASVREKYTTRSDAQGYWQLDLVPGGGAMSLQISDPRFMGATRYIQKTASAEERRKIDFVARPGAEIEGRVVDEKGLPVAGLQVFAQMAENRHSEGGEGAWRKTDENGKYRLSGLAAAQFNVMTEKRTDGERVLLTEALQNVQTKEGASVQVADLVFRQPLFVTGTVTSEGQPVKGVSVGVYGPHRPQSSAAIDNATTDEKGQYQLPVLPGENMIYISGVPQGFVYPEEQKKLPLKTGEKPVLHFTLQRTQNLSGIVVDENGAPAEGVTLGVFQQRFWDEKTTQSDAQGRWSFQNSQPGKTKISVQGEWEIVGNAEVELPRVEPVKLVVRRAPIAEVAGRVLTPKGEPVADAILQLGISIPRGEYSSGAEETVKTDAQGRFVWKPKRREAKLTSVRAKRDGYVFLSGGAVTEKEKSFTVSDVVMTPLAGKRRGRVLDAGGKAVLGATIYVPVADVTVKTDAKGEFEIGPLPVGKSEIWAIAPSNAAHVAFEHSAQLSTPIELKIAATTPLPERDIEGAYRVLREVWQESDGKNWWGRNSLARVLMPYDAERAKEFRSENESPLSALFSIPSFEKFTPENFASVLERLSKITSSPERAYLGAYIGLKLAPHHREMSRQLLELSRPLLKKAGFNAESGKEQELMYGYALSAALAERLGEADSETLADAAFVVAERYFNNQPQGEGRAGRLDEIKRVLIESFGQGSVALVERASPELSGGMLAWALVDAAKELAAHDLDGALRVLEKVPPLKQQSQESRYSNQNPDFAFGDAAKAIVKIWGKRDPQAALQLARRVTHASHRGQALALAAEYLPLETARAVYREALQEGQKTDGEWGNMKTTSRIAAMAWNRDRALGTELFEQIKSKLSSGPASDYDWARGAEFWFYYARIAPGESRFQLEKMGTRAKLQNAQWGSENIAQAMTAVDPQRALEMARQLPNPEQGFSLRQKVARYLVLNNEERLKVSFDRWDVSETSVEHVPSDW